MQQHNTEAINLIKTAKGQIDAVLRMIEDGRYCVDISNQVGAAVALLQKANMSILENHLRTCVRDSFSDGLQEEKITEIIGILNRYLK